MKSFNDHKGVVEDVGWNRVEANIFGSCGDDKKMILYDLRQEKYTHFVEAHTMEVNSIDFNYFNKYLIITCSNDKSICLWDSRNLSVKLHVFEHHRNEVNMARWNPKHEILFASTGYDRRVNVWDMSRIGKDIGPVDAEDGPIELLVIIFFYSIVYTWRTYE